MASHYAWVLLRPISPHLSRGQRCISYYYFQTFAYQYRFASPVRSDCVYFNVFFPQPRQLNANDQEWIIDGPLSRRREQSLHAELNFVGSVHLPDISYRRFYRRLPFRDFPISIIFQLSRHIKPHGLDESFSRFFGFYVLRVFLLILLASIRQKGI